MIKKILATSSALTLVTLLCLSVSLSAMSVASASEITGTLSGGTAISSSGSSGLGGSNGSGSSNTGGDLSANVGRSSSNSSTLSGTVADGSAGGSSGGASGTVINDLGSNNSNINDPGVAFVNSAPDQSNNGTNDVLPFPPDSSLAMNTVENAENNSAGSGTGGNGSTIEAGIAANDAMLNGASATTSTSTNDLSAAAANAATPMTTRVLEVVAALAAIGVIGYAVSAVLKARS